MRKGVILALWMAVGAEVALGQCLDLADFADFQRSFGGPVCEPAADVVEMARVPGGGSGPDYDFLIGRFEITNGQFVTFLNDAQQDGGVTRRGSFLQFREDGEVWTLAGQRIFSPSLAIQYDSGQPLGQRYAASSDAERMPVITSHIASMKFCNWLTVASGMGDSELCYTESAHGSLFRSVAFPVTESSDGDLSQDERAWLVAECKGFRLPMTNDAEMLGPNAFNEWLKAAAYDARAPKYQRFTHEQELVPEGHWMYAYGRDSVSPGDANYLGSGDPFEAGLSPVGYFDGENLMASGSPTNINGNAYGVYDMSGNAPEFVQDRYSHSEAVIHGGSHEELPGYIDVLDRETTTLGTFAGFRVLRVP